MYTGRRVNLQLFVSDVNETGILFQRIFEKYSNVTYQGNPLSRDRVAASFYCKFYEGD